MDEWIPCSKKLPSGGQSVITCDKTGYVTQHTFDAEEPYCWIDDHSEYFRGDEIVAWIPIPEPYKEE